MRVTIDTSGLIQGMAEVQDALLDGIETALQDVADAIETRAKENCPVGSGELRGSIQSEVKGLAFGAAKATVYSNSQYAIYVHEGTGIHSRTGRGRKEVPWTYYDDKLGFYVRTSGIEATPFLEDASNEVRDRVPEIVRDTIARKLGGG